MNSKTRCVATISVALAFLSPSAQALTLDLNSLARAFIVEFGGQVLGEAARASYEALIAETDRSGASEGESQNGGAAEEIVRTADESQSAH